MTPRRTALTAAALVTPALLAAMLVAPTAATAADVPLAMDDIGRYVAPRTPAIPAADDQVRAESHAVLGDRLYSTNHTSLDIVDISDPANPALVTQIDLSAYGEYGITSVAASTGRVAVAIPATDKTMAGTLVLLNPAGKVLRTVTVGALPDMVTFDESGKRILVANEGEPNADYSVDPEGSISIIDVAKMIGGKADAVRTVGFGGVQNLNEYVRSFGPNAGNYAKDLEPEYITVQGDRAFVSLQENNAIAEIDLVAGSVLGVRGLQFKDHNVDGAGMDPSDRDGGINIAKWPVLGMPQPDAIASFVVRGQTYIISANEGDARDYPGFSEEGTVGSGSYLLDPTVFPNAADLKTNAQLGRLSVTRASGDLDDDGDIDQIMAFGTRSVSIWTEDGTRVWDSGDQLERATAAALPLNFNANNTATSLDNRSDNKGPEPEGVAVGQIDGRTYAFVGLERIGGMAVFDVTSPTSPTFVEYVTTRDFTKSSTDGTTDSGPEVMSFVSAENSPNGKPLVVMSNEWSGTIVIWSPKS